MIRVAVLSVMGACFLTTGSGAVLGFDGTGEKSIEDSGIYRPFDGRRIERWKQRKGLQRLYILSKADINKDGVITWSEVQQSRKHYFDKYDTDGNGIVSEKEIEAFVRKRVEKRVKYLKRRFDQNGDGKISKEEFDQYAKKRFAWRDFNEDNRLSGEELPPKFHRMQAMHKFVKEGMRREGISRMEQSSENFDVNKTEKKK